MEPLRAVEPVPEVDPDDPVVLDPSTGRPVAVTVSPVTRFTPNEMAALKAETGRTMSDLQDDESDGMRLLVWLVCRRHGHPVGWEESGDIEMAFATPTLDPTSGAPSTSAPPSAATSTSPPQSSMP